MEIIATLQNSVETIFALADELVSPAVYHSSAGEKTYDSDLDEYVGGAVDTPVRVIETSITAEDREASPIEVEDMKILVPYVDLEGIALSGSDSITYLGTTKNILARKKVPGQAIHIFFIRKQ